MAEGSDLRVIKDTTANPGRVGPDGPPVSTTVLLKLDNAGAFELNSVILATGIFYGGLAQVFACWMEWKQGQTPSPPSPSACSACSG